MDPEGKRGRARSFLLGGLLGAGAALATSRRRARDGRGPEQGVPEPPPGLAAFERAPCYEELAAAASPEEPTPPPA